MDDVQARVEAAVTRFAEEYAPWRAGETVAAAVSGGPDSLCLLGALVSLQSEHPELAPGRIVVAHLDHGLRGEAGRADSEWVRSFAARLGLVCVAHREDVRTLARRERRSLEDAARQARYAFLRQVAEDYGAARICVGHTRDDQVETIVMHFVRGSGLTGLAGMRPLTGDVARPLLTVARADTIAYCATRGWQPRLDMTNEDTAFTRNRIRNELLPALEQYNPNLRETLLRNADMIREDNRYLDARATTLWAFAVQSSEAPDALRFSLPIVRDAPPALRHRLLRHAVERLTTTTGVTLSTQHIQILDKVIQTGRTGSSVDLPGRLRVLIEYDTLSFERQRRPHQPATECEVCFVVPGVIALPALGWRLTATVEASPPATGWLHSWAYPPVLDSETGYGLSESEVVLDADVAGETLTVRTWRPGDRMKPLGMSGQKKLQDVFGDAGVPRRLRHRLPLVYGASHLLWVAGLRLDKRARVKPDTRRGLRLRLEPLASDASSDSEQSERE